MTTQPRTPWGIREWELQELTDPRRGNPVGSIAEVTALTWQRLGNRWRVAVFELGAKGYAILTTSPEGSTLIRVAAEPCDALLQYLCAHLELNNPALAKPLALLERPDGPPRWAAWRRA